MEVPRQQRQTHTSLGNLTPNEKEAPLSRGQVWENHFEPIRDARDVSTVHVCEAVANLAEVFLPPPR
jgi:hypothetical protein